MLHCEQCFWGTLREVPGIKGQLEALELGLGSKVVAELVSQLALLYLHHQGELSSTALVSLPKAAANRT